MKICYFITLILLTSLKINIHRPDGPSGRLERGPSVGFWRPLAAVGNSATSRVRILFPREAGVWQRQCSGFGVKTRKCTGAN